MDRGEEDERLDLTTEELDLILQAYRELYPEIDLSKAFFFFDEIQNVNGWEKLSFKKFLIFRELYRKSKSLFFHKEDKECDFILEDSIPIQVCFDFSDPAVKKRELDGLVECCRRFNFKKGLIITFDEEDVLNVNGYTFTVVPAYKWLLKKSVN